jgi:DNA-binding transcriptional regulator GbsR (MarR family)
LGRRRGNGATSKFARSIRGSYEPLTLQGRRADAALAVRFSREYYFCINSLTRQGRINVTLTPAAQKFVLHWGEMGQAWGINRTMAQVHALLFVAPTPLDAEEISTLLDVSRSNVSTSLRELITWGVVRRVHIIGDRRDRFEALKDVMETFRVIMAERKRREMDPTIALLEHCVHEAKLGDPAEQYTREQLEKMLEFTKMVTQWYGYIDNLSTSSLERLFRGGAMLAKVFGRSSHSSAKAVPDPEKAGAGSR